MKKLKTLRNTLLKEEGEEEHDRQITISFPDEIIQDILSRVPVKPILQFRSVSKQWLSLISDDPSFPKLHFNRSHRTALLFSAYDSATKRRHFLSAPPDGGPLTHLITLDNASSCPATVPPSISDQHLNGLVLITSNVLPLRRSFAFVINPATRKVFKLPVPSLVVSPSIAKYFFFGFHRSRNEHCVVYFRTPFPGTPITDIKPNAIEVMIYSLSTNFWRKIDVKVEDLPVDLQWFYGSPASVCVNSVIHLMLEIRRQILAFDLTTEKFSTIDIPRDAIPREKTSSWFDSKGVSHCKMNCPYLMDINGSLGLVCHDRVVARNEMYFWILQDYDSCVWVKEIVTFSDSWIDLNGICPEDFVVNMDKIVFSGRRLSGDGVTVPIYDMKTKGFKFVQFTLGEHFLSSNTMKFGEVRSYAESILPLKKNEEGLNEDDK